MRSGRLDQVLQNCLLQLSGVESLDKHVLSIYPISK